MTDKNMKFTLYSCLIVLIVSVVASAVITHTAKTHLEEKLFEMQGQINGLKGLIGVQ